MRIAVLSPFVDRRHGTERALAELIVRLDRNHGHEVHLYSQRVDLPELTSGGADSKIVVHHVPSVPGPHLCQFLFWLLANRVCRIRDSWLRDLHFDAVFSPGINALDMGAILVHAVFHRLRELQSGRPSSGLRGLHRSLYYSVLCALERRIYSRRSLRLAGVSHHTQRQLAGYFGRTDAVVIPNGVDTSQFSPATRLFARAASRAALGLTAEVRLILLVGNDFRNKGLAPLLAALETLETLPWRLCVVGGDDPSPFGDALRRPALAGRVTFHSETPDILAYYSAADLYVAPSLEDSFNLPALEAMACGLPIVVSPAAGISESLTNGRDALLLPPDWDSAALAATLQHLLSDSALAARLGESAAIAAQSFSWDRHAELVHRLLTAPPAAPANPA